MHMPQFLTLVMFLLLEKNADSKSRPYVIQPPPLKLAPNDEITLTIDQIIRRVLESHEAKNRDASPGAMGMMMSGEPGTLLAEMDMLLTSEQYRKLYRRSSRQKRKIYQASTPWTNAVIPYILNPWDFSGNERAIIHLSMWEWEQYTCVKFRPTNSSDTNKLVFQNGFGCNSQLGQVGGFQALNLEAPGCRYKGLYLHEIGHALGLVHEHQLPNRDSFIDIIWSNVKPEWRQWFNKYSSSEFDKSGDGIPYDLASVMHYGITAFSKDDRSQTIRAKDQSIEYRIGHVYKKELSFVDIKAVNHIYKCSSHCPKDIKCSDEGFVGKDCTCTCPDGSSSCQISPKISPKPAKTCLNAHKSDADCDKWAADDQCSLNPVWMIENCRKSCKKCDRVFEPTIPPKICPNSYNDTECDMYAKTGECIVSAAWMFHNCKASCGWCKLPNDCRDLYSDTTQCNDWKSLGQCERNPAWMWANCRKTCGICEAALPGCVNKAGDNKCYADASVGECKSNSNFMIENCGKACGKCGKCYNEFPDDSVCIDLANEGECTYSPEWMGRYCKKACDACEGLPIGVPRPCADKDVRCSNWAKQGECDANPAWMIPNCQKSCNKCNCINTNDEKQCDTWANSGQCDSNSAWMAQNCQKSCRFCTNLPPPPDRCTNQYEKDPSKCDEWAAKGECFKNPLFMIPKCRKSCSDCSKSKVCDRWSGWSQWTGCSRTCGSGMKSRTRRCLDNSGATDDDMVACTSRECPIVTLATTTSRPTITSAGTVPQARTTTPFTKTTTNSAITTQPPVTNCLNTHQRDSDCESWASNGHCDLNPSWMQEYCARSCKICTSSLTCTNKYGDDKQCEQWANAKQCTENPSWMLSNCAKACDQCITSITTESPTVSCVNSHPSSRDCDAWAKAGHCQINPSFMLKNCAKSCGCGSGGTSLRPPTTTTTSPTGLPSPPPPDCIDKHPTCSSWASSSRNFCTSSSYVRDNCKFSCGNCQSGQSDETRNTINKDQCQDKMLDCMEWAREGLCISDSRFMSQKCPLSCEKCRPEPCMDADDNCARRDLGLDL